MKKLLWSTAAAVVAAYFGLAAISPSPARAAEPDKKTARVWKSKCASCHGLDGKGKTEQGEKMGIQDFTSAAVQKDLTDDRIKKAVTEGITRTVDGKKQQMDSFKDDLTADQVDALVTYIRALKK